MPSLQELQDRQQKLQAQVPDPGIPKRKPDDLLPLSMRLNNPFNIRKSGDVFRGEVPSSHPEFKQFEDLAMGFRAGTRVLVTRQEDAKRLLSVREQVSRSSPSSDNNPTEKLVARVAAALGVDPDTPVDFADPRRAEQFASITSEIEADRKDPRVEGGAVIRRGLFFNDKVRPIIDQFGIPKRKPIRQNVDKLQLGVKAGLSLAKRQELLREASNVDQMLEQQVKLRQQQEDTTLIVEAGFFRRQLNAAGDIAGRVAGEFSSGFDIGFGEMQTQVKPFDPTAPLLGAFDATRQGQALVRLGEGGIRTLGGAFLGVMEAFQQSLEEIGLEPDQAEKAKRDLMALFESVQGFGPVMFAPGLPSAVFGQVKKTARFIAGSNRVDRIANKIRKVKNEKLADRAANLARRAAAQQAKEEGRVFTELDGEIAEIEARDIFLRANDMDIHLSGTEALRSPDEILDTPGPIFTPTLTTEIQKKATRVAQAILASRGFDINSMTPLRVQQTIAGLLRSDDKFSVGFFAEVEAAGLKKGEFIDAFLDTGSEAGRSLNVRRQFFRIFETQALREAGRGKTSGPFTTLLKNAEDLAIERRAGLTTDDLAGGFWRQYKRLFRKLVISLPSTAARNLLESGARLGISGMNRIIDSSLRRVVAPGEVIESPTPLADIGRILGFSRTPGSLVGVTAKAVETSRMVRALAQAFPKINTRLFTAIEADLARARSVAKGNKRTPLDIVEVGVDRVLLALNRGQEYVTRRAVFGASLDRKLKALGSSVEEVVDEGIIPSGFTRAMNEAIEESLDLTFALQPRGKGPLEQFFKHYAGVIEAIPAGMGVVLEPFAAFLYNAARFVISETPTGGLRLLRPKVRAQMLNGEFDGFAREVTATAIMYTAFAVRNGTFPGITPGAKFDEVLNSEGQRVSLAPFVTFGPFLFMADFIQRVDEGRLLPDENTFRTFRRGLLGSAPQAGEFSDALDEAFKSLLDIDTFAKFEKLFEFMSAGALTGFLRPVQLFRDLRADFDMFGTTNPEDVKLQREVRGQGAGAPIANIFTPGNLPERESPTRGATPRSPDVATPFGRVGAGTFSQMTGLRLREKRVKVEQQLTFLGFGAKQLNPKTGSDRFNALVLRFAGPSLERLGEVFMSSEVYNKLSIKGKQEIARNLINLSRGGGVLTTPSGEKIEIPDALALASQLAPAEALRLKIDRLPGIQKGAVFEALNRLLRNRENPTEVEGILRSLKSLADQQMKDLGL